jgi:hypothetical protein
MRRQTIIVAYDLCVCKRILTGHVVRVGEKFIQGVRGAV